MRKRQRKKIQKVCLAALLCMALSVTVFSGCAKKQSIDDMSMELETTPLAKGDLENTITTTCTITSANAQNVANSLSEPIQEVFVKVGDIVTQGQPLCTIQTTALTDKLLAAQKTLADAQTSYTLSVQRAERSLADAQNNLYLAEQAAMKQATQKVKLAQDALESAYVQEAAAFASTSVETSYNTSTEKSTLDNATTALAAALAAYNAAPTDPALKAAYEAQQAAYNTAVTAADQYKASLQSVLQAQKYNDLKAGIGVTLSITTAQTALTTAQAEYDVTYADTYPTSDKAGSPSIRSGHMSVESARDSLADAKRNNSMVTTAKLTVKTLKDQIEKAEITAPIAGTIMVCDAVPNLIKADVLFTISSSADFQASGLLNEYDATRVKLGMQAEVSSDATGETLMHATIVGISPKAVDADGDFTVTVKLQDPASALREGMVGKIRIIAEQSKDCFYVPGDSIGVDKDGNSAIYVLDENGKRKAIAVTPGLVTDYYTEISSEELSEGMAVLNVPVGDA